MFRNVVFTAAAAFLAVATSASAHPKLVAANPGANAVVSTAQRIQLRFSEKLVPAFSKAQLTMAAMPGMGAMKMESSSAVGPDGQTLMLTPKGRLPRGRYAVDWQVVSADTHKVSGSLNFTVK